MYDVRHSALVETAREAARARIAADRRRAPADVSSLLTVIGERLFEPAFDAAELERVSPSDQDASWHFRRHLGSGFQAYIDRRRMETASDLLERTDLSIAAIAECVGFEDAERFAKWFKRRAGRAPARLRSPVKPRRSRRRMPGWMWRDAYLGRLGRDDYVALIRSLRAQYPEAFLVPEEVLT